MNLCAAWSEWIPVEERVSLAINDQLIGVPGYNQGKLSFTLSKSVLGCMAFLMLFPLDVVMQIVENSVGVSIPVGMLGIFLAAFLSIVVFFEAGLALTALLINFLFFVLFGILVLTSKYGDFLGFYTFLRAFFVFCVGYYFGAFLVFEERTRFYRIFIALFFVLCLLVVFGSVKGLNYLRLADGFSLLAFLILARFKSQVYIFSIGLVSIIVLYVMGARFSLLGFLLSASVLIWIRSSQVRRFFYPVVALIVGALVYYVGYFYFLSQEVIRENRFVRLVYASDDDGSFTERMSQFLLAKDAILSNVYFGEYKYYEAEGLVGAYAHNLVSYWAEFGVFGFLYSLGLVFFSTFILFLRTKIDRSWSFDFVVVVNVYFLSGLLLAKSYHWLVIYFIIGVNLFFIINLWSLVSRKIFVSYRGL